MRRYLIVANQTLGGDKLEEAVRERVAHGESRFHVLVPMTQTRHEATDWTGGFSDIDPELDDAARSRAEQRLQRMIERIKAAGGAADGEVGDPDPAVAVKDVLKGQSFDEVIVSTLPTGISGWLKADLPSRVARMTGSLVTTIKAE